MGGDLRHEGVREAPLERGLESTRGRREVSRRGEARDIGIGVGQGVQGDAEALVIATAAEVGGVDQPAAGGIQLRHEGVAH